MQYAYITDTVLMEVLLDNLELTRKDSLQKNLEDTFHTTTHCLGIVPTIITHEIAYMMQDVMFTAGRYTTHTTITITSLFI